MLGIIRVKIDATAKREHVETVEMINGVNFIVVCLKIKNQDGILDKAMMHQVIRVLSLRGVDKVAMPSVDYLLKLIERYNITRFGHEVLLRKLAFDIIDFMAKGNRKASIFIYARGVDNDVMQAVISVAKKYKTAMIDFGIESEYVYEKVLQKTGTSLILDQVKQKDNQTIVFAFDKLHKISFPKFQNVNFFSVALDVKCNYNDVLVEYHDEKLIEYTDANAVLGMVLHDKVDKIKCVRIVKLIKF